MTKLQQITDLTHLTPFSHLSSDPLQPMSGSERAAGETGSPECEGGRGGEGEGEEGGGTPTFSRHTGRSETVRNTSCGSCLHYISLFLTPCTESFLH